MRIERNTQVRGTPEQFRLAQNQYSVTRWMRIVDLG